MGVDVARACQEITVQAVSFLERRGPVFYASLPVAPETLKGCRTNGAADQHRLVSSLWDHLVALRARESPLGKGGQASNRAAVPIQVVHDPLGRPRLRWGENRGPAISFSEGGGKIWAALCGDESDIGIDVAETNEFQGEYPVHRVFHGPELHHALLWRVEIWPGPQPCSGRSRKPWPRPWDAPSTLFRRGKSTSIRQ